MQHHSPSPPLTLRRRLVNLGSTGIVVGVQLAALAAVFVHPTWLLVSVALAVYVALVFGIVAGYHRYFSHHAFETGRAFRFVLAWLGTAAMQNGPLWWTSWHRVHHRFSDAERDPHSPVRRGLMYAHIGWVLDGSHDAPDLGNVKDLASQPELRFLDRWKWLPVIVHGVVITALLGWPGLVWAFALPTALAFHAPLLVNSLGHLWGTRRYETKDRSRNNLVLALLTLGDGWHNNHHHAQRSARAAARWWELDVAYYVLRILAAFGIVWDLKLPETPRAGAGAPVIA